MAKKPYIIENVSLKIAERVRKLRIDAGYTSYEDFALDAEIDRKQYWRIETGANITLKTLVKIINKHKISLADFFENL